MTNNVPLLYECFKHFFHLDHSNAPIHVAPVRYSPLTFRLAEEIDHQLEEGDHQRPNNEYWTDVYTVLLDLGAYEEDRGR